MSDSFNAVERAHARMKRFLIRAGAAVIGFALELAGAWLLVWGAPRPLAQAGLALGAVVLLCVAVSILRSTSGRRDAEKNHIRQER
jgi:hypothetical protein